MTVKEEIFLGPAMAREVDARRVRVELEGEEVWARLAMPWAPATGDEVLVTGREGNYYVIGLIESSGPAVVSVPGDLELRSEQGSVRIGAARGIELRSSRLDLIAHTLVERVTDAYRWVKGLFHVQADRMRSVAVQESYQKAGRAFLIADEHVKVQGRQIHLG
jgi:hypothetical protein